MHKTILTKNQLDLLPLIRKLSKDYYLVDGTAIALHIGHRRSIDFDLFTPGKINRTKIKKLIQQSHHVIEHLFYEDNDQLHRKTQKISYSFSYLPARCRGEPYVRPRTNNAFVPMYDGRTQGSPLHCTCK